MPTTATPEEVWAMLRELTASQKETDRLLKETGRELRALFAETDRKMQETSLQMKETDRQMQETDRQVQETSLQMKETDRKMQETSLQMKETDRKMQETDRKFFEMGRRIDKVSRRIGDLSSKWGEFVENQVAPSCKTLFSHWGIPVHFVSQRVKYYLGSDNLEIDVLVVNEQHVVLVEVKSTLKVEDIDLFLEDLDQFKRFAPKHADKQVHGAVAAITFDGGVDRYAYQKGLFVLAQSGDNMAILNKSPFQPKSW